MCWAYQSIIYNEKKLELVGNSGHLKELAKLWAIWTFWFKAVKRVKEGCAEDAIFYFPKEREDQQWGGRPSESVTNLDTDLFLFLFWSSLCCLCLALLSSPCLQNVLWDFHCLAVYVVISNCSHSIFNMFPVSGFQLRRLVALTEC